MHYGGILLTATAITPKREFSLAEEYHYNRSGPIRWIISHLLRYKGFLVSFILASTTTSILFSAVPRLTGLAFDEVLQPEPDSRRLLTIALAILGVVFLRGILDLTNAFSVETLGQRLVRDARDELYINLLGKSQTFHNRQRVGDIMARAANDVQQLNPMMNPGVGLILDSMMSLFVPVVFIATIKVELLLSPLIFIPVFFIALRRYTRKLNPVSAKMRWQFGVVNAGLTETITGIEVVKSTAQEAQEKRKFAKNASLYRDYFVQRGQIQARYLPILLLGFILTGAFAHGLYLLTQGELMVGELVAYMGLMGTLRFPAFISIFTFTLVQLGVAGAERILELMREETELDENKAGYQAPIKGEIIFENVTFGYNGSPILKNISFRAEPGQTIAIVGQTGSGKSTLTALVNRIYDVSVEVPPSGGLGGPPDRAGRILIDGVDVRDWNLASLRSQISSIEQDIFLFSRSIRENIAFGLGQKATPEAIEAAARDAQAHDFITSFRDGYETIIGERGVTLSGGQRQRLAIARALLTNPRILILDDSTSAIDSATEDRIQQAINRVLQGRTTLLITHRLSQIRRADKILVLKQGEIIDQGTHGELMQWCGLYRRIFARYE
ncbi:MAG: ATP-binding cassette domain-containing protein [Phycisphaerae bacterium]|nr:ATP-binding cassette domain-containing protein [Phycisphaerae bacterium]